MALELLGRPVGGRIAGTIETVAELLFLSGTGDGTER